LGRKRQAAKREERGLFGEGRNFLPPQGEKGGEERGKVGGMNHAIMRGEAPAAAREVVEGGKGGGGEGKN